MSTQHWYITNGPTITLTANDRTGSISSPFILTSTAGWQAGHDTVADARSHALSIVGTQLYTTEENH